ncbi:MAG: DUF1573 domain-containing protein [Proteobacteria bacterium]|nr:DUF1573 domain-containing protein [Pseudomonadota bacterium]MBU1451554.1 DUF1573 domain-containing protein [Pseudomonadota bacterium]
MTRRLIWTAALLALFTLAASPALALKGPKIVFDSKEVVFSDVVEGKEMTAVFTFTNTGDQNLLIDKVSPSCGCTASSWDKVTPPGKKGAVTLLLDTTGLGGSFRKTAAVATNDPGNPVVTLIMTGETVGRIKVDQGRRVSLKGCLGSPITASATLRDPQGKNLVITGVENPMSDYLEVKLVPQPGGKTYRLDLVSTATEPLDFAGPLFLKAPGGGPVSVWVVAEVRGPFTVRPHEVMFGTLNKDTPNPPQRSVLVKKACADKLKVDLLDYNKKLFIVERDWQKPGEELLLVITPIVENLLVGPFDENLLIQMGQRAFTVKLTGRVR